MQRRSVIRLRLRCVAGYSSRSHRSHSCQMLTRTRVAECFVGAVITLRDVVTDIGLRNALARRQTRELEAACRRLVVRRKCKVRQRQRQRLVHFVKPRPRLVHFSHHTHKFSLHPNRHLQLMQILHTYIHTYMQILLSNLKTSNEEYAENRNRNRTSFLHFQFLPKPITRVNKQTS